MHLFLSLWLTVASANVPHTPQQAAQQRADWMVKHNYRWHPPYYIGNVWRFARFEGVGWGGSAAKQNRMGTCTPRRRMRLIADAFATNGRFSVRVRLWR